MTLSRSHFPILFFVGSLIGSPLIRAANTPAGGSSRPPPLTLSAAVEEALGQSPMLNVIAANVESARGEVITAQTRPIPELSVEPGWKRVREGDTTHNEFKGTVGLTRTFLFPGKQALLVSIAERNVALRQLATEGLRFQLRGAIRKAFYELLAAQKVVGLRRQQLDSAQTFQQAAAKRAESGYASDFEAVKSQGDVINARKLLAAAEGAIAASRVELNSLLGRDPTASLEVSGALEATVPELPLADLLRTALLENPSLRVQALQAEIAGLNIRKARLARKPDISVGPSLEYSKSEQILGIGASIPLPTRSYGRGEVLTATAEQRKILAETAQLRREITSAVTLAATRLGTARNQLALYSPAYLEQLKTVVDQAERSYAQNATSLLIYLDAKRTYFDTLADYYEAIATVANSRAELESALGTSIDRPTSAATTP